MESSRNGNVRHVRSPEFKLPVFFKGNPTEAPDRFALIDAENFQDLMRFRWKFEPDLKSAYRDLKMTEDGRTGKEFLHRRIMCCETGDAKVVKFREEKDGERLDCRKQNLYFDNPREVAKWVPTGPNKFPLNRLNFARYVEKHHAGTAVGNFVASASVIHYSPKRVAFMLAKDASEEASPSVLREIMADFLKNEFGFKGDVSVIRHLGNAAKEKAEVEEEEEKPVLDVEISAPPEPKAAAAAVEVPATRQDEDAIALLRRFASSFGLNVSDSRVAFSISGEHEHGEFRKLNVSFEKLQAHA